MNSREQQLMSALDENPNSFAAITQEEQDILDLAHQLSQTDYSAESTIRAALRSRLIRQHRVLPIRRYLRPLLATAAAFSLLSALVLTVPPLRALAQEIIDSLFNRAASDAQVIQYDVHPTPISMISPSVAETFSSVTDAEKATGIDIRQPTITSTSYALSEVAVNHSTQTIWLTYNAPGRNLSIYQRPAQLGWLDDGLVGSSAQIIAVDFDGANGIISGEYVAGGWLPTTDPTPTGDQSVSQGTNWSTDIPQRRLRWQDANWVYEMTAFGGDGDIPDRDLMQDDLIAIAKSMH